MKNNNRSLLIIIFFTCFSTLQVKSQSLKTILLYPLTTKEKSEAEKLNLLCMLKIDTVQIVSKFGMHFSICIKNNNKDTISMDHFFKLFNVALFDSSARNIVYDVSHKIFSNRAIYFDPNQSVVFEYATINGEFAKLDVSDTKPFKLNPNSNIELFFRIKLVIDPTKKSPMRFENTIPPKEGLYYFSPNVIISSGNSHLTYSNLRFPTLIHYQGCND